MVLLAIGLALVVKKLIGPVAYQRLVENFKWLIAYFYLKMMKRKMKPMFDYNHKSKDLSELGITSPLQSWLQENPRKLLSNEHAADSLNLWGADKLGNLLMLYVARRHGRIAEVYLYLRLESGEEYQLPVQPDLRIYNTDGRSFSAKGLSIEVLEPLRRWRFSYNGLLRKGVKHQWDTEEDETVCVQFNFVWHPMFNYSTFPFDFNPSLTASLVARQQWNKEFLRNWKIYNNEWHEQWGQMHGQVYIDNKQQPDLLLTGTKLREYGVLDWKDVEKKLVIRGISSAGLAFDLYAETQPDASIKVFHGEIAPASCIQLYSMSECKIENEDAFFSDSGVGQEININIVAEKRKFHVKFNLKEPNFTVFAGDDWNCEGRFQSIKMEINGKEGFGIIEYYQRYAAGSPLPKQQSVPQLIETDQITDEFLVMLEDPSCRNSRTVGGKGASLALMTTLKDRITDFTVPPGLCLTRKCFEKHLEQNSMILSAISNLEAVAWKRKEGSLEAECSKVVETVSSSTISSPLQTELKKKMVKKFGDKFEDVRFAVRSSAIGEDSEEISAAGQNDTLLGVLGFDQICKAILKCWASQFSFRAVEYKRQNGQLLNGGMGIVIQEMVPADIAGVLFTKDPVTGSLDCITITANYGLGESVVSAAADPDTAILRRNWADQLTIVKKTVGMKEVKVIMSGDGGTSQTPVDLFEASKSIISDSVAMQLGETALLLEKYFGSPRDIEWAIKRDKLFLLQARPVTSDTVLTDFEVWHEFDTVLKSEDEQFSTGNVAEVMPGAMSPLSLTFNIRAHGIHFQKQFHWKISNFRYDPSIFEGSAVFTSHVFFDVVQQKAWDTNAEQSIFGKAVEVGMYGRVLNNRKAVEIALKRFEPPPFALRMLMMTLYFRAMIFGSGMVRSVQKNYSNRPMPTEGAQHAREAYQKLSNSIMDVGDVLMKHIQVTFSSMIWNALMLKLLAGDSTDFTLDHYSDFATLIGSSIGAESGNVPISLQAVALAISEEDEEKKFSQLSAEDAMHWLKRNTSSASVKFENFLARHGHRCIKEFDLKSISWGMDPLQVIKVLQVMLKNPVSTTMNSNISKKQCIDSLKTPLSRTKKFFLSWLLARSKNGVCYREMAKSMLVKFGNCLRLSCRHLAKLLVQEGFIPDEELMFMMSFEEIGQLINTRSARIIMRARRRLRCYDYMDQLVYPEFIDGFPKPISDSRDDTVQLSENQVKGYPVCYGKVIGTARVVISFNEIHILQPDDILITHATDIGWSPYFPMLRGVVTEIGGLISHGAVVAREYGLPCVIGAENATKIFKSGDKVLLDSTTGIVAKITEEDT